MRQENLNMQAFLRANGIDATPKYIIKGSLKGCWRLYNHEVKWSKELADKFNSMGFTDIWDLPLDQHHGNGGIFSVFVRGHDELLTENTVTEDVSPFD